jgi:hypothetical protein
VALNPSEALVSWGCKLSAYYDKDYDYDQDDDEDYDQDDD